ncbi:DegV family protein [Clostridium sp. BJN0001]|uniref:DegV family protein n=1 Tax=Clostridium sp. BJN0001 TaxID=2930219 RepID=UPI001FD07A6B|nr:DegV family protein [Clostridium sp. BJN0001]
MEKIALITDSACDLKREYANEHNIEILPFKIIFSDKEYDDGIDITPKMLYSMLPNEIPTTSLPSTEKFISAFKRLKSEGYTHAIVITISSGLSGTFNAARLAAETYTGIDAFVFDSMTLTMAEGAMILNCERFIKEGKSFEEIKSLLPSLRDKIDVYFTMNSLEYLRKGGRIGKVSGTIADALNLKPIIEVGDDGIYHTAYKIRGIKQSITKLSKIIKTYTDKNKCKLWIMDGDAPEKAQSLYELIKDYPNIVECTLGGEIGPALGVHTGSGLIGFIIEKVD